MPRRTEVLKGLGGAVALLGTAALLPWLPPAESLGGRALLLLFLFLLLPALTTLALEAPLGRRCPLAVRLVLVLAAAVLAILVTAWRGELAPIDLIRWSSGGLLIALAAHGAASLAGWRRFRPLFVLAMPVGALFAPFMADSWILGTPDPIRLGRGIEGLLRLSSWPGAAGDLLGQDLFKNEGLYREFRVGEQIYALPTVLEAFQGQALLALALLGLGGFGWSFRVLLRRILPRTAGCGPIRPS